MQKKRNYAPKHRLESLRKEKAKVIQRDDFCIEFAALLNFEGYYEEALELMNSRNFHPWEGGEGQVLKQYTFACLSLGQQALKEGKAETALKYFEQSIDTPDNLGEKYHPLQAVAHINYLKGLAYKELGKVVEAQKCFEASANEAGDFIAMAVSEFSEMSYYRALSLRELGKISETTQLLTALKEFAISKLEEEAKIDYFATSLPLLLVFEDDLNQQHQCEHKFLLALAEVGLGNVSTASKLLKEVLAINTMHIGAQDLLRDLLEVSL